MSATFYFAYGANMSKTVLARRNIKPTSSELAWLTGYSLSFSHPGPPLIEPAFASVEPSPLAKVYGVLYRINEQELSWLDHLEKRYLKLSLPVSGETSGEVHARVYQTPKPIQGKKPSRRYLQLLIDGAKENQLPQEYIQRLETQPYFSIPVLSWLTGKIINQRDHFIRIFHKE